MPITRLSCLRARGNMGCSQQLGADGTVAIGRPLDVDRGSGCFIFITGVRNQDKLSLKKVILLHFSSAWVTPQGLENRLGAVWMDGRHTVLPDTAVQGLLI